MSGCHFNIQETPLFQSSSLSHFFFALLLSHLRLSSKITEEASFDVRLIDTGEIAIQRSCEIYEIDGDFETFPRQAYVLHLVGIIPMNSEDDWADDITTQLQERLSKLENATENMVYEALNLFQLRGLFVANMARAVDPMDGVVHIAIAEFLVRQKLAVKSITNRRKAVDLAKANGMHECSKDVIRLRSFSRNTQSFPHCIFALDNFLIRREVR